MLTAFISYGGPDQKFASKLNEALKDAGINTFFFPLDAKPGDKLHHTMRNGVNDFDKVIFICSKNSLTRMGVINELEEALQREAREGGKEILIPISLDNYILKEWNPDRPGLKQTILDRVIGDFRGTKNNKEKFNTACSNLISVLGGSHDIKFISFHSKLFLDEAGKYSKVIIERKFIIYKPIKEIIYTNFSCSGEIVPLSSNLGALTITDIGGNKALNVTVNKDLPLNEEITHELEVLHINAYMEENEDYSFIGLSNSQLSSMDIYFPNGRRLKKAAFKCILKNNVTILENLIKINPARTHIHVSVNNPVIGAIYVISWSW